MGMQYQYFAAGDDAAAISAFRSGKPLADPHVLMEEVMLGDLGDFEQALTGRSAEDITADPRYRREIAVDYLEEDPQVEECGLVTITDSFAQALAGADLDELPGWFSEVAEAAADLAVVARHAVANGQHMYCIWLE